MVSSALEMTRWLQLHLGDGTVDGHAVLGQETLNELHTAQVASTGSFIFAEAAETSYGMGWEINQFGGSSYLYHGGGIFGFPAYVAMMPEINAGVVVLGKSNMDEFAMGSSMFVLPSITIPAPLSRSTTVAS